MKNLAVLLAAGGGTRMGSRKPKNLIKLSGKPIVSYAVQALVGLSHIEGEAALRELIAVVGVKQKQVRKAISKAAGTDLKVSFAHQREQLGTADAVKTALDLLGSDGGGVQKGQEGKEEDICILVLPADAPLITSQTLKGFLEYHHKFQNTATLLTAKIPNPEGYGRVIRGESGALQKIVEQTDASQSELLVNEVCTSIYAFQLQPLASALAEVQTSEVSGEYYLTDVVRILVESGHRVGAYIAPDEYEILGINTPEQFEKINMIIRGKIPNTNLS